MKKLLMIVMFIEYFLISGCSENNISQPELKIIKPHITTIKDNIPICYPLNDPLSGACNVIGSVIYLHQILSCPGNERGVYVIQINLEMNSEICSMFGMMHPAWSIAGNSEDIIYVSEEGIEILEKTYQICNRTDILLLVKYLITTEGTGIAEISIKELFSFYDDTE